MGKIQTMKKAKKSITITGNLLPYDVKNSNRRIYTKECAIDIVQQFVELNHKSSVLGQLDFPKNGELALKDVSHRVESMDINEEKNVLKSQLKY